MNDCHPFCKHNEAIVWTKEDHQDRLGCLNGQPYVRKFTEWNEGEGYKLVFGNEDDDKEQSYVVWDIKNTTGDATTCVLSINVYPWGFDDVPKAFSYLPFQWWIKPKLETYLQSVIGGVEYYLEHKESVPRNHFGTHPWFS